MAGYPVTPGYTINIVKDKQQPAVILLNSAPSNKGTKTFYITVPESSKDDSEDTEDNFVPKSCKRKVNDEELIYFVEDRTEEVISTEVIVEEDGSIVSEAYCDNIEVESSDLSESQDKIESNPVVYFEENNSQFSDPSAFFTEVAHEEVVIEEVLIDNVVEERKPSVKSRTVITNVQCDLCNSKLDSAEEAKWHMRHVHSIVTYDGPFFKCEFCGIFVTDRVSHMKVAHYSPLAQAFCKTNSNYQCLQCNYTSDQLTNIRNHVDAKHSSGDNKYLCEECNSEYKTLNSMRAHKSRVHVKKRRLVELNQIKLNPLVDQKLKLEILDLEQKTFSKFVKR